MQAAAAHGISHASHSTGGGGGSGSQLPEELLRLADAAAPVMLPPPRSVPPGSLDNRELDKLVGTLGRSKATWRRSLVLSQWLQESGHALDDRLCTTVSGPARGSAQCRRVVQGGCAQRRLCPHAAHHAARRMHCYACRAQLIRVCSEHGQAVTALSVYEWMKAPAAVGGAGLQPTVYTYTAAMRAALAAGLLDRALQVWEDAQAACCQLDCRLCITYIEVRVVSPAAADASHVACHVHAQGACGRGRAQRGVLLRQLCLACCAALIAAVWPAPPC